MGGLFEGVRFYISKLSDMSVLQPHFGHRLNDSQVSTLNKVLVICFGVIATLLAFLAPHMGGIIQVSSGN